jgi:hypothetical protein
MFGSIPRSRITSRLEPGGRHTDICVDGQVILRIPASLEPTTGRFIWKS